MQILSYEYAIKARYPDLATIYYFVKDILSVSSAKIQVVERGGLDILPIITVSCIDRFIFSCVLGGGKGSDVAPIANSSESPECSKDSKPFVLNSKILEIV